MLTLGKELDSAERSYKALERSYGKIDSDIRWIDTIRQNLKDKPAEREALLKQWRAKREKAKLKLDAAYDKYDKLKDKFDLLLAAYRREA